MFSLQYSFHIPLLGALFAQFGSLDRKSCAGVGKEMHVAAILGYKVKAGLCTITKVEREYQSDCQLFFKCLDVLC